MDLDQKNIQPFFTVVVVVPEYSYLLTYTLNSIMEQTMRSCEIICIVQENLKEEVSLLLESYDSSEQFCIVHTKNTYFTAALNMAIAKSHGLFLHFLYPGDQYLSERSLSWIHQELEKDPRVDFFYGASMERKEFIPKTVYRPLEEITLKKGCLPTKLHACIFSKKLFQKIGTFNEAYRYRSNFEMMCRIHRCSSLLVHTIDRVYLDYEYRKTSMHMAMPYAWETSCILKKYFGFIAVVQWYFSFAQKDILRHLWYVIQEFFHDSR
jgi:hypothetical protein